MCGITTQCCVLPSPSLRREVAQLNRGCGIPWAVLIETTNPEIKIKKTPRERLTHRPGLQVFAWPLDGPAVVAGGLLLDLAQLPPACPLSNRQGYWILTEGVVLSVDRKPLRQPLVQEWLKGDRTCADNRTLHLNRGPVNKIGAVVGKVERWVIFRLKQFH